MYCYLGFNQTSRITCPVDHHHQNKGGQGLSRMKKQTFLISNADDIKRLIKHLMDKPINAFNRLGLCSD